MKPTTTSLLFLIAARLGFNDVMKKILEEEKLFDVNVRNENLIRRSRAELRSVEILFVIMLLSARFAYNRGLIKNVLRRFRGKERTSSCKILY